GGGRVGGSPLPPRRTPWLSGLDALQLVVVEKLVTRRWKQRRGGRANTDSDHTLVELAKLVDQRCEVTVAGAHDEGRHVVADERELDRVDRHLDVGGILAHGAHPLRHLDQLDVGPGEHPPVLVEVGPVRIRPPDHDSPPLGQGVGDRTYIEGHAPEGLAGADGEVLVAREQRDAILVVHSGRLGRTAVGARTEMVRAPSWCCPDQIRRTRAACCPRSLVVTSNSTRWFSSRLRNPLASMAEK